MNGNPGFPAHTLGPLFNQCIFEDNRADGSGGAVSVPGFLDLQANLTNCIIRNNQADGSGGGISAAGGRARLFKCELDGNEAGASGGGILTGNSVELIHCVVIGNKAAVQGGGVHTSALIMSSCQVIGNEATLDGGGVWAVVSGGGEGIPRCCCTNSLFARNIAGGHGGGLRVDGYSIINCTIVYNKAGQNQEGHGGGISDRGASIGLTTTIDNSILYFNEDSGGMNESAQVSDELGATAGEFTLDCDGDEDFCQVFYSDIQGSSVGVITGVFVIDADPVFQDPIGPDGIPGTRDDNYRLKCGSPCKDMGNPDNTLIPSDDADIDNDDNLTEKLPDPSLNNRLIDAGCTVDMGAFEAHSSCIGDCAGCVGESCCNGGAGPDGVVNVLDLIELLLAFGTPGGPCDIAPACSGDGVVNVSDLIALLLHWGSVCPGSSAPEPQSLEEALEEAGLTMNDWDDFMYVIQNGTQEEKDNWHCWMLHYLSCHDPFGTCNPPPPNCPGSDPFGGHRH